MPAGDGDAGLVCDHDELRAVATAQLVEQPADVGLNRGYGQVQRGGDLAVGLPGCYLLDAALMIAVGAWLLDKILSSAVAAERSAAARPARRVRAVSH